MYELQVVLNSVCLILVDKQMNEQVLYYLSLGHFLYHFAHDGTITVVLTIEVLRFVTHPVSSVTNHWNLNLGIIWFLLEFTLFV